MFGYRVLGRYRVRSPLIASLIYLIFAGVAHGTMYLLDASADRSIIGIQNLILFTFYLTSRPWKWALESLELLGDYMRLPTPLGFVLVHTLNAILVFVIGMLIVKMARDN